MIFATHWFSLFAAAFFPIYWLLWRPLRRAAALLAAGALFHRHFAGPAGVLPVAVLGLVTYACPLSGRRSLCLGAIILCVASLVFYKYALFLSASFVGAIHPAWGQLATTGVKGLLPGLPPLGISFFVFEFVHYLTEVSRGG